MANIVTLSSRSTMATGSGATRTRTETGLVTVSGHNLVRWALRSTKGTSSYMALSHLQLLGEVGWCDAAASDNFLGRWCRIEYLLPCWGNSSH
jgi:hypothetical protein